MLLVDLRTRHRHLRIRQDDGDAVAVTLNVLLRELTEVDPCLQLRVDRNGDTAVAKGNLDVELSLQHRSLQPQHVVVSHDLVYTVLCRVKLGTFPHLRHQGNVGGWFLVSNTN